MRKEQTALTDQPEWKDIGAQFEVGVAWRLPEGGTLSARLGLEVVEIVETLMRLECQIVEVARLSASIAPDEIDAVILGAAQGLVGKYVRVPYEAAQGTKLNLKVTTLTGEHGFFSAVYPRPKKAKFVSGE